MEQLFKAAYFLGIVVEMVVRAPHERQRRQIPKTDRRVTGSEQLVLVGLLIGMVVLPAIDSLSSWLDVADYPFSPSIKTGMGIAGVALLGAALWLFWRSHHDLGKSWSPTLEIGAQQALITHGVYRAVRHPMYTSQVVWSLAQALLLHNWIAGFASLVAFLPLYFVRIPSEERMMVDHFGDEYRAYAARTGRIVPRLRG